MQMLYVIIPVYNASRYIKDTVASVSNQSLKNIHIVLVDDGSTDSSLSICKRLANNNSQITLLQQNNEGVSSARNTGISYIINHAHPDDYITFLDADDYWAPHALNDSLFARISDSDIDIHSFGTIGCTQDGTRFSRFYPYVPHITAGGQDTSWSLIGHFGANFYRVGLLAQWKIRFFEKYRYSEDKYFRSQCAFFAKSIEFHKELLYVYRANAAGAMSHSSRLSAIDYFMPIIEGWRASDAFINNWSPVSGTQTNIGVTLGNVYLLDMAAQHFKNQGSAKEIWCAITTSPQYSDFLQMKPMGDHDKNYRNHQLLFHYPQIYALKYRIIGILEWPIRLLVRLWPFSLINTQRKYPLSTIE